MDLSSRLKICKLSPATAGTVALRAITLLTGFIKADSAVIGRLIGVVGEAMSTMTTLLLAPVSRMQMNLSDSMVTFVKEMNCWLTPMLGNCKQERHRLAYYVRRRRWQSISAENWQIRGAQTNFRPPYDSVNHKQSYILHRLERNTHQQSFSQGNGRCSCHDYTADAV